MKFTDDTPAEIMNLRKEDPIAEEEYALTGGKLIGQWLVVGERS